MIHQITNLYNGTSSTDGSLVRFEMHGHSDEVLSVQMPTNKIGHFVSFLVGLGQFAGRKKAISAEPLDVYEGTLLEASHISFAKGRTEDETILVIQLGAFAIGIAVPNKALESLQRAVSDIHPQTKKPN